MCINNFRFSINMVLLFYLFKFPTKCWAHLHLSWGSTGSSIPPLRSPTHHHLHFPPPRRSWRPCTIPPTADPAWLHSTGPRCFYPWLMTWSRWTCWLRIDLDEQSVDYLGIKLGGLSLVMGWMIDQTGRNLDRWASSDLDSWSISP